MIGKGGYTSGLEDTEDLAAGNTPNLSNTVRIPKNHTNLRWCKTLLCKLANVILHLQTNIPIRN